MDKSTWSAAQWQAHIEKMMTYAERKEALQEYAERKEALQEVPEPMRVRVQHHLMTVLSLKKYHDGLARAKKK